MLQSKVGRSSRCKHSLVSKAPRSRSVLGIETSCDDTGAAVSDETGAISGESSHSQKEIHSRTGGIIPTVAQELHRENIERVVREASERSGVTPAELCAVATTVKPGSASSSGVGSRFSQTFVRRHRRPFIPIHHMEAHASTVRMLRPVSFPFSVLSVSGGHALLATARGVDDFSSSGHTSDEAPGDTSDKVARRSSLRKHPACAASSGGQAIESSAKDGDRKRFCFRTPMGQTPDCCFSFAGLRNQITMSIKQKEAEEGVEEGTSSSCASDIAAAAQHTVALHSAKRTHRAVSFCKANRSSPTDDPTSVLSGGVASNQYIRKALMSIAEATGSRSLCPPARFCTDNGAMIAWNGVERSREGKGISAPDVDVGYEPRAPSGVDITAEVRAAAIRLPSIRMKIPG